jgi:uncharacterized protein (UPF0335 family)
LPPPAASFASRGGRRKPRAPLDGTGAAGHVPARGFHSSEIMAKDKSPAESGTEEINSGQLRAFIERIERLNEEKKALAEDVKEVYAEAKANGFDTKIIRKIVSIRGQDPDKRVEEETLIDLYLAALGAN